MKKKDLDGKKFEELMNELDSIVKELENGDADLEDSIKKYSEAMEIVKVCSDKLNNAEEQVNKILKSDGTLEDFNVSDEPQEEEE